MPTPTPVRLFRFAILTAGCFLASCGSSGERTVAQQATKARSTDGSYIAWREHLIDDEENAGGVPIRGADGLQMGDLDNDGHADIVSVHEDSDHVRVAFAAKDPGEWFRLSLAEGQEAGAAEDVALGDLNGDGFLDAVIACEEGHLLYLQNPAGKVRGFRWERVIPEVTKNRGSWIRVFLADFNGDGRAEVVAANKGTSEGYKPNQDRPSTPISWFELPENPLDGAAWKEHVLTTVKVPINSQSVDLDGDGDLDILAGSRNEFRIFWFENLGGEEIRFEEHPISISPAAEGPEVEVQVTGFNLGFHDFNNDGRLDVALASSNWLVWIEQPDDFAEPWTQHPIGTLLPDELVGFAIADINGDGKMDVMTGAYSRGPRDEDGAELTVNDALGRLAWFENPGDAAGTWTRHDISRRKRGMYDAFIPRDMDGDGDMDFVATRGNSGKYDGVFWLEQIRSSMALLVFEPARQTDSQPMSLPSAETP
ncbi:MAG: VCBS repeat-containing protein [Bryobacterales bacterium]